MGLLGSAGWQYTKMKLFLLKYATFEGVFFHVFMVKTTFFENSLYMLALLNINMKKNEIIFFINDKE